MKTLNSLHICTVNSTMVHSLHAHFLDWYFHCHVPGHLVIISMDWRKNLASLGPNKGTKKYAIGTCVQKTINSSAKKQDN